MGQDISGHGGSENLVFVPNAISPACIYEYMENWI